MSDAKAAVPATTTAPGLAPARHRAHARLFLISFLVLFHELACIRWFGSTVIFLTFFTNLVLMACFLGMSVGCLAADRRRDLVPIVLPLLLLSAVLALGALWAYGHFGQVTVDLGGQQEQPQQIFFGTEDRPTGPSRFIVPMEVIAGTFFVLIALMFVGLGQVMGRCFNAIPNRVEAYTTNVGGSLAGIVAFGAASWFRTPPWAWFCVSTGLCLPFVTRRRWAQVPCAVAVVLVFVLASHGLGALRAGLGLERGGRGPLTRTIWSPYYKVEFTPRFGAIHTNNLLHQIMLPVAAAEPAYSLPHLLNRDAGNPPFEDVMVIGAGSGNDVQAALAHGAKHVEAVEIDPVLYELGRAHHPDRPYSDPRVSIQIDDGRSILRRGDRRYDLITYSVVDSLVLHSGYSSLRLESFLFTEEALRDIKARLKPNGMLAMYNYYRQGWVVARLDRLIEKVFGARPLVISVPYKESIEPGDSQQSAITFVLVGNRPATGLAAIRRSFESRSSFWSYVPPRLNGPINGFAAEPPLPGARSSRISPARVETTGTDRLPTDDWPFLYLREPEVPALNLRGMAIVGGLSLALLLAFAPVRTVRPNGQMFFLGAGFMLLETKGVVHMALLFGSTWIVNSIVFFTVLVMILLSNCYVLILRPQRQWPYYALLIVTLAINAIVPMSTFLAVPGPARVIVSCAVVFLPVFFAGVLFATAFRSSTRPDVDFGSNIGGAILGGLSENLSMVVGFQHLLFVAIGYYVLSAIARPRGLVRR